MNDKQTMDELDRIAEDDSDSMAAQWWYVHVLNILQEIKQVFDEYREFKIHYGYVRTDAHNEIGITLISKKFNMRRSCKIYPTNFGGPDVMGIRGYTVHMVKGLMFSLIDDAMESPQPPIYIPPA